MTPTGTEADVCRDIAERQAKGIAKYGVTVAENPLSEVEWLQHLSEELTDAAIYAKRTIQAAKQKDAEIARLREALAEYGDHVGVCPKKYGIDKPCQCGFEAALDNSKVG